MKIPHLTLKMTTAQVVETPVTNNSPSEDYSHPDDHTRQTTDTPGFKPFTNSLSEDCSHPDDHTRQTTDTPGFKPFTNSLSVVFRKPMITQDKQLILLGKPFTIFQRLVHKVPIINYFVVILFHDLFSASPPQILHK